LKPHPAPLAAHGAAQKPEPLQKPEQHWLPALQGAVFAAHDGGAWHVAGVPEQRPVQHSPADPQVAPFCLHGSAHWLEPLQNPEQQAPGAEGQALPFAVQACVQTWVTGSHEPEAQSVATAQESPFAHFAGQEPPQSTSVSSPSLIPSVQLGAAVGVAQRWVPGSQKPEAQSAAAPQPTPFAQVLPCATQIVPPQSTPVSPPFITPSVQVGAGSCGSALDFPPPPLQAASASAARNGAMRSERRSAERRSGMRAPQARKTCGGAWDQRRRRARRARTEGAVDVPASGNLAPCARARRATGMAGAAASGKATGMERPLEGRPIQNPQLLQ
jgi:hypothetical protein